MALPSHDALASSAALRDTHGAGARPSQAEDAECLSMDDISDLSPVCSVVLSPSFDIKRASLGLRNLWGLQGSECAGRPILPVINEHVNLPKEDQDRITNALQTSRDRQAIQTLSGQCRSTSEVQQLAGIKMAWSARIIPVSRGYRVLAIVLEWAQTELSLPKSAARTPPLRPSLVQPLSPISPPPSLHALFDTPSTEIASKKPAPPNDPNDGHILSGIADTEECFRILIESVRDYAIFLLDVNGNIATWGAGAELNKGYTHDEIIGKHFSLFYSPEDVAARKPEQELEDCLRDGRVENEGWRILKDGSQFWANVTITAVYKDGVHVGYGKITRNVTDRRAAELRVIAAYEESAKLKADFLANMSHEIRTPMHGMLSACSLLLDTPLAADQRDIASIIDDSGQALLRVINDILDYSKLASGSFSIHSDVIGVASIAAAVVRSVQPTLQPKVRMQLSLASDLPRAVQGDPLRFRQILLNIAGNATKFTDKGYVHVAMSVKESDDDTYVILTKVTDTGIGIPQDTEFKLFVPFTQGDTTMRKRFPGTGLGLSICKSLVELMGGTIGYEPNPEGQGSVFWFTARLLKIKSLSQLKKPDVDDHAPAPPPHARLARARSPPGTQLSLFELERMATIPPPLDRIAKTTGLSKAEVASGSGYDVIEYDSLGFPVGSPTHDDAVSDCSSDSTSAPTLAMATPSSEDGPASSSDAVASIRSTSLPTPLSTLEGEAESPKDSLPSPASEPLASGLSPTIGSIRDPSEKLNREFETSLALLRERAPRKRLLVAEDNRTNQRVLLRILKDFHFSQDSVVLACNGAEAVAQAREQPTGFDLCIMDVNMPVVDGHEATVQIRKMGITIPVMAMTAHALQGDREQCLAYGMNDYIAKPVNKRMLVEKLLAWLPE